MKAHVDTLHDDRQELDSEIRSADDVLADKLDRRVSHRGRRVHDPIANALAHIVLRSRHIVSLGSNARPTEASAHLEEELGILRDEEADRSERFRPERDGGRLGRADDALEERLVQARQRLRARELQREEVDPRLLVIGAAHP